MDLDSPFGRAIGLMSGTSGDGVDAILLELGPLGRPHRPQVLARHGLRFDRALQAELCRPQDLRLPRLAELHYELATHCVRAARALPDDVPARVCGMHGQTLWHQTGPQARLRCTLQMGCGPFVAQQLGLPVVSDLRAADLAQGGLGAPISPLPHWFFWGDTQAPAVIVNLGGMCNFTAVGGAQEAVVGYDVGPAMALSDAYAVHLTDGALACDRDGQLSRGGLPQEALIQQLLAHPFVRRAPPKSCGREEFSVDFAEQLWQPLVQAGARPQDIAMSLLHAPLRVLRDTLARDPRLAAGTRHLVFTGGGAKNPNLIEAARQLFADSTVEVHRSGVFAPANHEPAAMALIAARTLCGLQSSLPQVTGARRGAILGSLAQPG